MALVISIAGVFAFSSYENLTGRVKLNPGMQKNLETKRKSTTNGKTSKIVQLVETPRQLHPDVPRFSGILLWSHEALFFHEFDQSRGAIVAD